MVQSFKSNITIICIVGFLLFFAILTTHISGKDLVPSPTFSIEPGVYDYEPTLEIHTSNNCKVFYTFDCTDPTTSSEEYTEPLTLTKSISPKLDYEDIISEPKAVVVKAVAVDELGIMSPITTGTYIIDDHNEYDGIEIISISTNPEELFGAESGICVPGNEYTLYQDLEGNGSKSELGANYKLRGTMSERRVTMEYFNSDHALVFCQDCGFRVRGGMSRDNAQKSFNIFSREEYSESKFFKEGILNQSNNEHSVSLYTGGQDNIYKFKDALFCRLMKGTDVAVYSGKPCYLFLNGNFWGLYWLCDRYDRQYFVNNYNTNYYSTVVLKVNEYTTEEDYRISKYEQLLKFVESTDLSNDINYNHFCSMVDIQSLMEYYAANFYIAHTNDWPYSNVGLWREEGGKWQYCIYDINSTSMSPIENEEIDTRGAIRDDVVLSSLFQNAKFRKDFYETFIRLEDTVFQPDRVIKEIRHIDNEFGSHLGSTWDHYYSEDVEAYYNTYVEDLIKFFSERRENIEPIMKRICKQ